MPVSCPEHPKVYVGMATATKSEGTQAQLEQLAHVVSNDLAQPLTTIAGFARLLISRYDIEIDEQGHEYLGYIVKGATDMEELIDEVVTSLRPRPLRT
jgi:light-regulated signal transduction histidine kinase (bacteriophytochrome)